MRTHTIIDWPTRQQAVCVLCDLAIQSSPSFTPKQAELTRRSSSDGAHHNLVSTKETAAAASTRARSGHERFSAAHAHSAPQPRVTRAQAAREAAAARGNRLGVPAQLAAALVGTLFVAACVYWIVVGLLPPVALTTK